MFPEHLKTRVVEAHRTIIQTMTLMDECNAKSLLVFDQGRFRGLITIGDLQRAIIAKKPFDTEIGSLVDFSAKKYARIEDDQESIRTWMMQNRAEMMPVLNSLGDLVDIVFWEDILGELSPENERKISLPVVIMAGGKGVRLKPITNVIPKPLVPIGNKTILEEIMDQFEAIGCTKFYLSVNYKSEMIRFYLNQLDHKYDVEYFEETEPRGTIGSVSMLKGRINTPFFVSNCDILIDQDYRDVYDYHLENHNDLTVVTAVKDYRIPYGVIETGDNGLLTGLREKPEWTYMINTGVYLLTPECISEIPVGEFFHITQLIDRIKDKGGRVGCFPVSEHSWKDMGEWKDYLKMTKA